MTGILSEGHVCPPVSDYKREKYTYWGGYLWIHLPSSCLSSLLFSLAYWLPFIFLEKKAQKKQEEQQAQIEAAKQTVSMLVIDKKRLRIKESGLPQMVIDQTPKMMRRTKLPIVKAKIGPKISILIADEKIYEQIPVKKEVKADISGLYIVGVRGIRGHLDTPPAKKKGFFKRMFSKKN